MGRPEKIRLGESLVQQKLLTEEQLKAAIDEQQKTGRRLGRVCIERGLISEEQLSRALARQLGVDYIDLKHYNIKREVVARLPETQVRRFRAMVIEDRGEAYLVGMADPTDLAAYDEIARILKREIELVVVTESELLRTIDRIYRRTEEITGLAQELRAEIGDSGTVDFGALAITPGLDEAPVVKLLQVVLFGQPELDQRLAHTSIRQLRQRITFQYRLSMLKEKEVEHYLSHRLRVAGYRGNQLFTPAAVRRLHRASGGVPRLINIMAHKSLLLAFGEGMQQVLPRHVRNAAADTPATGGSRGRWIVLTALLLLAAGAAAAFLPGWLL